MFGIFGKKKEKKDTAADRQKNAASDTCTLCGQPLDSRSTFLLKRQKVCKACHQKSKPDIFCSACGREGPLYSWEGKQYCSSCYRSLVRANACGLCWKVLEKGVLRSMLPPDQGTEHRHDGAAAYPSPNDVQISGSQRHKAMPYLRKDRMDREAHAGRRSPECRL